MVFFNKNAESKKSIIIDKNGSSAKIGGIKVGERVVVSGMPDLEEAPYPKELVGIIGVVSKLIFDDEEDFPEIPIIRVNFNDLPKSIEIDEDGDKRIFDFYENEIIIIR
jgi:hypothetical protein